MAEARGVAAPLVLMLAVQTLSSMAALMVPVMAPAIRADLDLPNGLVGLYTALLYTGAMVTSLVGGAAIPQLGAVRASQLCLVLAALAMLSTAAAGVVALALGAALLGAAYGPITPASSDVLARVTPPGWRALVFSLKQTGVPLGGALAGIIAPLLVIEVGWTAAGPVVAVACLLVALALQPWRSRLDQPVAVQRWRLNLFGPITQALGDRAIARLAWASFLFAMLQHAFGTFLVSHLVTTAGYSLALAGGVLAAGQGAGALGRILWGAAADRVLAPRMVLALLALAMAAASAGTALIDPASPVALTFAVAVLFGASAVGWNGVYLAEVARLAPAADVASVTGGCLAITYCGVAIGPVVFTVLVALGAGYGSGYWLHAGLALAACVLLIRR